MRFLIQTFDKRVLHDFSFALIDSCHYQNWLNRNNSFKIRLTDEKTYSNYIPIGSVEFVSEYLLKYYGVIPKPKNIPEELIAARFTGRSVFNGTEKDIVGLQFVKSNDKIKSFTEICSTAPIGNYQISDIIEIKSEWRAFVYNGNLVGLQNYSGAFDIFPNVGTIKEMISEYKTQPISYTLDVAIVGDKTVIIEVHDFFSCGLYGFANYNFLPFMFSRCFYSFTNKSN